MWQKRPLSPVEELKKEKLENLERCFSELESYKQNKLILQYPVFFIPGWTGEDCAAWQELYPKIPKQYKKYYLPAKYWIEKIIGNKESAHFITFTEEESESSPSFFELGRHLKRKLLNITNNRPFNLVGHSMGGLDIRSAIIDEGQPVLNVKNVITVGTPNNGTFMAGLLRFKSVLKLLRRFKKFKSHHITQGYNLYSGSEPIKKINALENRLKLLNGIEKFYIFMGLRDGTVGGSPKLDKAGLQRELYEDRVKVIQTSSAEHSGKDGITQDPRLFLPTIKVLCGIELKDNYNRGYIYRKES
ncbi:MAG: hypothetical protein ISS45_10140 [Candidatus Omnitrophica bacterium]|nr:hypothetical protein [Candidatus Omnitrophota bacterium]